MDLDDSNKDNPKVPSAINLSLRDHNGRIVWGNGAKGSAGSLEWFKLLLVDEDDLSAEARDSEHVRKARTSLDDLAMTPEHVISEHLRSMWDRCLEKMKQEVSQATVDKSRFHIVITLPAICECSRTMRMILFFCFGHVVKSLVSGPECKKDNVSERFPPLVQFSFLKRCPDHFYFQLGHDYARNRMRGAANDAGLLNKRPGVGDTLLSFVSEPEAAALATLKRVDGRCDVELSATRDPLELSPLWLTFLSGW